MKSKDTNRRDFIKGVTKVSALTMVGLTLPTNQILAANSNQIFDSSKSQQAFLTLPYLQSLTPNSVDIMFITQNKAYSWILYGENNLVN